VKITISTTVITFESFDDTLNRMAVETIAGVVDAFPPKKESADRTMHRLAGLVDLAQHKVKEYLEKHGESLDMEC